ncbi:MAG: hypothetical protein AAF492_30275, partial [Verrucomicrobiota bacterium]
ASNQFFNRYEAAGRAELKPTVENLKASHVTANTAWLNASVDGDLTEHEAVVYWGPVDGGTNPASWAQSLSAGSVFQDSGSTVSVFVTGLSNRALYHFTFRLTNCAGSVWATPSEFLVTDAPPLVDHASGATVCDRAVRLNGNLVAGNRANVFIYWGDNDGGTNMGMWDHIIDLGQRGNGFHSATISGLLFGERYYYRFFATNSAGAAWAGSSAHVLSGDPRIQEMKITLCGYDRPESLIDFPMLVELSTNIPNFSYQKFRSPGGFDLRFMNESRTVTLNYEIEEWNPGGVSTLWVQVPEVIDWNTSIWARWGGDTNRPVYTTNGATWSAGYEGVWHMSQPDPRDSSPFGRHGTGTGGVVVTAGRIGSGLTFA